MALSIEATVIFEPTIPVPSIISPTRIPLVSVNIRVVLLLTAPTKGSVKCVFLTLL